MRDCIIVGGGPAGLTAALYLARFLRSVTVFDAGRSRAAMIPRSHNFAALPAGISGADLLWRMRDHARHYGAKIVDEEVLAVHQQGDAFRFTSATESLVGRSVIFACGVYNHRPPLAQPEHDAGVARGLIRYCPVCDGYEVRGKRVAILGAGKHGLQEARFLTTYSSDVSLIPPQDNLAESDPRVVTFEAGLKSLALSQSEVIMTLTSQKELRFDTLYVAMGTTPQASLAKDLRVELGASGHIKVNAKQRTSVERIFAIGDLTEGLDQIAVAMGQAAIAATQIHNSLA